MTFNQAAKWMTSPFLLLSLASSSQVQASETTDCDFPDLYHAIVLFGDDDPNSYDYRSANHTFGNAGGEYAKGISVNGKAQFPNFSVTVRNTFGVPSELKGGNTNLVNFTAGVNSGFSYDQQEWIDFANALYEAQQANPSANGHINFYFPNGGSVHLKMMDQTIHLHHPKNYMS